jgi:hypothetical protein
MPSYPVSDQAPDEEYASNDCLSIPVGSSDHAQHCEEVVTFFALTFFWLRRYYGSESSTPVPRHNFIRAENRELRAANVEYEPAIEPECSTNAKISRCRNP